MSTEILLSILGTLLSGVAVGFGLKKTIQKRMAEKKFMKYFVAYLEENPEVAREALILLEKDPTDPETIRRIQEVMEPIMEAYLNKKEKKEISEGLYQPTLEGQGNYILKFLHPKTEAYAR